jgi:putative hydrolase of the HAD superfamily
MSALELFGVLGSVAAIIALWPVYIQSQRRRRWTARRKALKRTPGATKELRAAVKAVGTDLHPAADDPQELEDRLREALDGGSHDEVIQTFLREYHRALVDEDVDVRWSPRRPPTPVRLALAPPAVEHVSMVGRQAQLLAAFELLDARISFRICGPPGIGKSTLLRAIRQERPASAYVRLEQGGEPLSELRLALNRAAGTTYVEDDAAGIAALVREIPDGFLLFVDNADEVSSARAIERLAGHLPQLTVVVTTRAQRLDGFQTVDLPPLPSEAALDLIADVGLSDEESAQVLDEGGGNPQLILQGAWAARDGSALVSESRLSALLDRFPVDERRALLMVGEFPSATLPHGLLVDVGDLTNEGLAVLQRNAVLRRENLLSTAHQTLRVACQDLVATTASRERCALRQAAAGYFVEWISAEPAPELIDATWPAINYLLESVDEDQARIVLALALIGDALDDPHGYIPTRGLGTLLLRHLDRLEQAAVNVGGVAAARLEKNLGLFCFWSGNPRCKSLLARAEARFREAGDLEGRASSTWVLGNIADDACEFRKAERLYRAPLEWLGASPARAVGLHLVGVHLYHQGRYVEARSHFFEALAVAEDPGLRSRIERRLAYIELAMGDTAAAIEKLEAARSTSERLHRPRDVARLNRHIAKGLIRLGRLDDAVDLLEPTRSEFERLGDNGGVAATDCVLAGVRRHQERYEEAKALALSSVRTAEGPNPPIEPMLSPLGVAFGEDELGQIAVAENKPDRAASHLRRALNIFESVGHARAESLVEILGARRDAAFPPATTVIFDLVDTLAVIDSDAYEEVKVEHARSLGVELHEFQEAWSRSRQRSSVDASWTVEDRLTWVCRELGHEVSGELLAELAERERRLWSERVHLRAEGVDLLAELRRRGYRTAVLSNGSSAIAGLSRSLRLAEMVDVAAVSCELGVLKPDPRAYERLLALIPAHADDCIFVGDGNDRELEGAKAAGLFAVRLRGSKPDYSSRASLDWDATVQNLPELWDRLAISADEGSQSRDNRQETGS